PATSWDSGVPHSWLPSEEWESICEHWQAWFHDESWRMIRPGAFPLPSSPATGVSMGPPAGDGAELQLAFAPFHAPELVGLDLVFQILRGLEQRGFERVVPGLGVKGRAMNQPRSLARVAGGF